MVHESSLRVERERIVALEQEVAKLPPVSIHTDHHLFAGCYYRSILVPAGTAVTGHIHLHANSLVLVRGKAYILNGEEPVYVEAPWCAVGPAGTKRVVLAIEDCVFLSVHPTPHTDVAKIAEDTVVATYKEYDERKAHELVCSSRSSHRSGGHARRGADLTLSGTGEPESS